MYFFHHVTAGEVNSWDILLEVLDDLVLDMFKKLKFKWLHIDYEGTQNLLEDLLKEANDAVKLAECLCKH